MKAKRVTNNTPHFFVGEFAFFATVLITLRLNPWLVPVLSVLDWTRRAAAGVIGLGWVDVLVLVVSDMCALLSMG